MQDLVDNCEWTWTTMNDVNGYEVRGRNEYASNSIFLPAAGYGYEPSLYYAGSDGLYWSSVPYSGSYDGAWYLGFGSGFHYTANDGRERGRPVRPVQGFTE